MKLKSILVASMLLAGCNHTETTPTEITKTDSLLMASDSVILKAEQSTKLLDSVTTATTQKVNDNVNELEKTINVYETQIKSALKVKQVEKIIHDTVYIETKKSFWGKTKTNITTKSDSITNESEKIDTLQQ